MLLLTLVASLVATASAQTFSIGIGLGGNSGDVVPTFDSQRSTSSGSSSSSSDLRNPFKSFSSQDTNSRSRSSLNPTFEDFFSSSRVATPSQRAVPSRVPSSRSSSSSSDRPRTPSPPPPPPRGVPTPNPTITSRGAPSPIPVRDAPRAQPQDTLRSSSRREEPTTAPSTRRGTRPAPSSGGRAAAAPARPAQEGDSAGEVVRATPDLSSRGRVQEEAVVTEATRPPSSTETPVPDVRTNLVGQSVCARGTHGDACREHLATTAMACSTGFCQECQQCGTMSPDLWPRCCREHFLCCRPLAKACQSCDTALLRPFCGAAFGRCN